MSEWTTVEGDAALPEGGVLPVDLDGLPVILVRHLGCVHAFENRCTHDGSELTGGHIEDGQLVCPHHGARFQLPGGAATCAPAYEPLTPIAARVEGGVIQLKDDRW
ncbi:MAG: Rieske 2Fe-2S domain-containing protein [Pseudomonadota bacterium]|nr:Rieske 2Fe-2S domain-containing protein [Pseudomonadota bacterium]